MIQVLVRVLLPHAEAVTLADGGHSLQRIEGTDIFEWRGAATEVPERYRLIWRDEFLQDVQLSVPGLHNVYNSLAAAAVGLELEIPPEIIAQALAGFEGVDRRLQVKGEAAGAIVIDDYGHHPTEIRATLSALAAGYPGRRRVVVFQPHRYTRLKALYGEFCTAFNDADCLVVTDVYPAGEKPVEGVTGEWLLTGLKACGHKDAAFVEKARLTAALLDEVREGDIVLTLGAGDVWKVGEELLAVLIQSRLRAVEG